MKERKGPEIVIQTRLVLEEGQEQGQIYYIFPKWKTTVYPLNSGRGILQADLQAQKLEKKKVRGYQAWKAETTMLLFLKGNRWELPPGSFFGAPVKSARQVKVKLKQI